MQGVARLICAFISAIGVLVIILAVVSLRKKPPKKNTKEATATVSPIESSAAPYRAGEVPGGLGSHETKDWDLLVAGLGAAPYQPISFRDPPNLPSLGNNQPISYDLSKCGESCGPDILNPPFIQSNNACWYSRGFMDTLYGARRVPPQRPVPLETWPTH